MAALQNFSVDAASDLDVVFTLDNDTPIVLAGAEIVWCVYPQQYGTPTGDPAVITKMTSQNDIVIPGSPPETFVVSLIPGDTEALAPGNYYHEGLIVDVNDQHTPVVKGVMTVSETQIRSSP